MVEAEKNNKTETQSLCTFQINCNLVVPGMHHSTLSKGSSVRSVPTIITQTQPTNLSLQFNFCHSLPTSLPLMASLAVIGSTSLCLVILSLPSSCHGMRIRAQRPLKQIPGEQDQSFFSILFPPPKKNFLKLYTQYRA